MLLPLFIPSGLGTCAPSAGTGDARALDDSAQAGNLLGVLRQGLGQLSLFDTLSASQAAQEHVIHNLTRLIDRELLDLSEPLGEFAVVG